MSKDPPLIPETPDPMSNRSMSVTSKRRVKYLLIFAVALLALLWSKKLLDRQTDRLKYEQQLNSQYVPLEDPELLDDFRQLLDEEMYEIDFPRGLTADNFSMETGGQPIRSIIVSTWRSGSTFLGDILDALPGTLYHFEPLETLFTVRVREDPLAKEVIRDLKHILNCEYWALEKYLRHVSKRPYLFKHSSRLWPLCEERRDLCLQPEFLTHFCRLFPFHSMKLVRLQLAIAERLLEDESLNVRLLLLVRDPRGTIQSRKHHDFCLGHEDCDEPAVLCQDMVDDYRTAQRMLRTYPDRLKVVRYEDLAKDPTEEAEEIFNFFRLPFVGAVEEFLDSHTKEDEGGKASTFRDTKSTPYHWMEDLTIAEIESIQGSCKEAMNLWGYNLITKDTTRHKSFRPLLPYFI